MKAIAALYIALYGPYVGREDIDAWDESRDARKYNGPHPVVAHPPCERWGRYWSGGPSAKVKRKLGDDGGCFAMALEAVLTWGGVLEHPEASHAFRIFDLGKPPRKGGWIRARNNKGWICCVEQGHYGHPARKATWLFCTGEQPPADLQWGPAIGTRRIDECFHSKEERAQARDAGQKPIKRLSKRERVATPPEFAELLLSLARSRSIK